MNKALGYFIEESTKKIMVDHTYKEIPIYALVSITTTRRRIIKLYFDKATAVDRRDKLIERMENQLV